MNVDQKKRAREATARWRARNPDKCRKNEVARVSTPEKHEARKAKQRECAKRWREYDPARAREVKLIAAYGIDLATYAAMVAMQSGACAICFRVEGGTIRGKARPLAVDHCHKTNMVRGLLCNNCNRGLGFFGEDRERMIRAIAYLARSK